MAKLWFRFNDYLTRVGLSHSRLRKLMQFKQHLQKPASTFAFTFPHDFTPEHVSAAADKEISLARKQETSRGTTSTNQRVRRDIVRARPASEWLWIHTSQVYWMLHCCHAVPMQVALLHQVPRTPLAIHPGPAIHQAAGPSVIVSRADRRSTRALTACPHCTQQQRPTLPNALAFIRKASFIIA